MSKQYGLIIPGSQKKSLLSAQRRGLLSKPSIFDESSSNSDDDEGDGSRNYRAMSQMKLKKPAIGPGAMERRIARDLQEKALAEDPTIFQYDELYDDMENKRAEEQKQNNCKKEPQKPKYIARLMQTAEKRKLENELRIERQVQKEREAEGDKFKDKESFVTSSYRKKLEEIRKLEQQNERDDYLETIGDVKKQQNLDGFYRHLYEQKLGSDKTASDEQQPTISKTNHNKNDDVTKELAYRPIVKPLSTHVQRVYRKRKHSKEEAEQKGEKENTEIDKSISNETQIKRKEHLTNNIDADSDFSIDDSSSDSATDNEGKRKVKDGKKKIKQKPKSQSSSKKSNDDILQIPSKTIAINLDSLKKSEEVTESDKQRSIKQKDNTQIKDEANPANDNENMESLPKSKPKNKNDIWRKRTVGEIFEAAVQRYFARQAARNAS